jgi:hypothetical protein
MEISYRNRSASPSHSHSHSRTAVFLFVFLYIETDIASKLGLLDWTWTGFDDATTGQGPPPCLSLYGGMFGATEAQAGYVHVQITRSFDLHPFVREGVLHGIHMGKYSTGRELASARQLSSIHRPRRREPDSKQPWLVVLTRESSASVTDWRLVRTLCLPQVPTAKGCAVSSRK